MSDRIVIQFETVDRTAVLRPEPYRVCFAIVDGRRAEIAVPLVREDVGIDGMLRADLIRFLTAEGCWP